jgi:hypothetical protein
MFVITKGKETNQSTENQKKGRSTHTSRRAFRRYSHANIFRPLGRRVTDHEAQYLKQHYLKACLCHV